jgi:sodium/hydrogen antiporter
VTLGIVVGPYVLSWVDSLSWGEEDAAHELTYQSTRIVVGIQVLFTGVSLPNAYLWKERLSLTVLLVGIMTPAWVTTALLI